VPATGPGAGFQNSGDVIDYRPSNLVFAGVSQLNFENERNRLQKL
jgi:hypothetical protein